MRRLMVIFVLISLISTVSGMGLEGSEELELNILEENKIVKVVEDKKIVDVVELDDEVVNEVSASVEVVSSDGGSEESQSTEKEANISMNCDFNNDGIIDISDMPYFWEVIGWYNAKDLKMDLTKDGVVDISDISELASGMQQEGWCYDTFWELLQPPVIQNDGIIENQTSRGGVPVKEEVTQEIEKEVSNEEEFELPQKAGFFGAITGAVTGVGQSLGIGATISYIVSILLLFVLILGGYGIARVVRNQ